eukprot:scaffold60977_cov69-Phaeocystis_antarctica.AAC.2
MGGEGREGRRRWARGDPCPPPRPTTTATTTAALLLILLRTTARLLDDGDALLLGLVRQHGAAHHVANGEDARHVGGEVVIHLDHAARAHLDADVLEAQSLSEGHAPRGKQHDVRVHRDRVAALDLRLGLGSGSGLRSGSGLKRRGVRCG